MGPPIFIGGNALVWPTGSIVSLLQWGRRFSSAEIPDSRWYTRTHTQLQWGRRFSSAEIRGNLCTISELMYASMGPPIFIGGNGLCVGR